MKYTSTNEGVKAFERFYGDVTLSTLCKFFGVSETAHNSGKQILADRIVEIANELQ